MYAHEYIYTTWRENPTPIVEALRGYLTSDYDYEKDVRQLRANREAAIAEMWSLLPPTTPAADREQLKTALDLALKMTPLTPDQLYMDQGTTHASGWYSWPSAASSSTRACSRSRTTSCSCATTN
jgi:pyruvate,water dikinase